MSALQSMSDEARLDFPPPGPPSLGATDLEFWVTRSKREQTRQIESGTGIMDLPVSPWFRRPQTKLAAMRSEC
jgi:hypothetical protein